MGSSPGWWAATAATYCPSRVVEHPKSKSTQPRFARRWVTLYNTSFFLLMYMYDISPSKIKMRTSGNMYSTAFQPSLKSRGYLLQTGKWHGRGGRTRKRTQAISTILPGSGLILTSVLRWRTWRFTTFYIELRCHCRARVNRKGKCPSGAKLLAYTASSFLQIVLFYTTGCPV